MKKLLLTLGLICCTLANAVAQGTIAFGNSVATRFVLGDIGGTPTTAADGWRFKVWYGPPGSDVDQLQPAPGTATIGQAAPGVLIGAPSVFAIPGTEPGQIVSMQIRGYLDNDSRHWIGTDVRQVTLGPTAGPGTVIWQSRSGTNPNRFYPIVIPEPSTIALGALAGVCLLFRARKSIKAK